MKNGEAILEVLKTFVDACNPRLVTKADIKHLEARLDELDLLVEMLEARLEKLQQVS